MKNRKLFIGVVAVVAVLALVMLYRKTPAGPMRALYAELIETNRDTFEDALFTEAANEAPAPFVLGDGHIAIRGADVRKKAKLFLVHKIIYEGKGRGIGTVNYYIFNRIPARVRLGAFDVSSGAVHLGIGDSIGKTYNVRLFNADELLINNATKEAIGISYGQSWFAVTPNEERVLSGISKRLKVIQDTFAPIPLDKEVTRDDFKPAKNEYGNIEFSTELKIKNYGLLEVYSEE